MNTLFVQGKGPELKEVGCSGGSSAIGGGLEGMDTKMTSTGNTLHDTLSASHQLLEVLCCLQEGGGMGMGEPLSGGGREMSSNPSSDFWAGDIEGCSSTSRTSSTELSSSNFESSTSGVYTQGQTQGRPSRPYSNTVVRHLVIACHTMLLEIFATVLTALQQDADLRYNNTNTSNTNILPSNFNTTTPPSTFSPNLPSGAGLGEGGDTPPPLADIRLVMVVQVCSYLVERQVWAVGLFLGGDSDGFGSGSGSGFGSGFGEKGEKSEKGEVKIRGGMKMEARREARSVQEVELQQRLVRLRETLRM